MATLAFAASADRGFGRDLGTEEMADVSALLRSPVASVCPLCLSLLRSVDILRRPEHVARVVAGKVCAIRGFQK